jgi:group I intron endonuclease
VETIRAAMTRRLLGEASGPLAGIYVVTHRATGRRYVGQSLDIARRWAEHRAGTSGSRRLTNALKKYGPDGFAFEIAESCAPEELNDRELFYISAFGFDCLSPQGYNLTYGGEGVTFTPEVRAKHREAVRGRSQNSVWQENVSAANRRRAQDPEFLEKNRHRFADPEFRARHAQATTAASQRVFQDPPWRAEWEARTAEAIRRRTADPTWREKNAAAVRRRADPNIHTIINVKTGERDTGTRLDFRERYGISSPHFRDLLTGSRQTTRGWRLSDEA